LHLVLLRIEPPHTAGLLELNLLPYRLRQSLKGGIGSWQSGKVSSLPFSPLGLLLSPQLPLRILNFALFCARCVHVTFENRLFSGPPCPLRFQRILLVDGCLGQGRDFGGFAIVGFDDAAVLFTSLTNGKTVCPLTIDCVQDFFLVVRRVKSSDERVLLS